jgi:hypothetical protein
MKIIRFFKKQSKNQKQKFASILESSSNSRFIWTAFSKSRRNFKRNWNWSNKNTTNFSKSIFINVVHEVDLRGTKIAAKKSDEIVVRKD